MQSVKRSAAVLLRLPKFIFTTRQDSMLCMQSAVLAIIDSVWPTVWPSVCHTLVSCQNDSSYDHAVFTGG